MLKKLYWKALKKLEELRHVVRLNRLVVNNLISRKQLTGSPGPVVSLTSYGKRVDTVYLAIESIGLGIALPSRIILWLDDQAIFDNLPTRLQRLKKRGLEIRKCENFGPHTKYYGYVESEGSFSVPLVTADDDVVYPRYWLDRLVAAFQTDPSVINCYRARRVEVKDGVISSYDSWPLCYTTESSYGNFATGVSGVIYPPEYLRQLKAVGRGFLSCCPKNDDIWLHVNAIRNGWKVQQISNVPLEPGAIPGTQAQALKLQNQYSDGNDRAIVSTYSKDDIACLVIWRA